MILGIHINLKMIVFYKPTNIKIKEVVYDSWSKNLLFLHPTVMFVSKVMRKYLNVQ